MAKALFFDLDGTAADTHAPRTATTRLEVSGPRGAEAGMVPSLGYAR